MDIEKKPFWMVWCHGGSAPTNKHATINLAETEAQRLARVNPLRTFVVLEAKSAFEVSDMQRVKFSPDADIPF